MIGKFFLNVDLLPLHLLAFDVRVMHAIVVSKPDEFRLSKNVITCRHKQHVKEARTAKVEQLQQVSTTYTKSGYT